MKASPLFQTLNLVEDKYLNDFYPLDHLNFLVKLKENRFIVVSVLCPRVATQNFKGIVTSEKETHQIQITIPQPCSSNSPVLVDTLLCSIQELYPESSIAPVKRTSSFPEDFRLLEEKHPQQKKAFKVAIVYCKKDQTTAKQMFSNAVLDIPSKFFDFVDNFGERVNLEGWTKYRGDMRPPSVCYYSTWKNFEIVYHVAPFFDDEEKRRLIGNDILVIFYYDSVSDVESFEVQINSFGEVPQNFAIVQRKSNHTSSEPLYSVGFFSRSNNVVEHLSNHFFDIKETKDLVLTRLYNGLVESFQLPPLDRLFYLPRRAFLAELFENHFGTASSARKEKRLSLSFRTNRRSGDMGSKLSSPLGSSPLASPSSHDSSSPPTHAASLPTRSLRSSDQGRPRSRSPSAEMRTSEGSFGLLATVRSRSRSPSSDRDHKDDTVARVSSSDSTVPSNATNDAPRDVERGRDSDADNKERESSQERPARKAEPTKLNKLMTFNAFCQDIWKSCEKKFSVEDESVPIEVQLEITEEFMKYPTPQLTSAVKDESFRSELIKKISTRDFSSKIDQSATPNVIVTSPRHRDPSGK